MSNDPKPEAEAEKEPAADVAAPKKTSLIVHIVMFLLVTGLAAGAGFGVSMFLDPGNLAGSAQQTASSKLSELDKQHDKAGDGHEMMSDDGDAGDENGEGVSQSYAKPLAPILTNLAAPDDVWVRLELAVVGKAGLSAEILEQIHQDLFAYMRTVKLHHVEGPSGYTNLRAELSERAVIRSGGEAKAVLVRTLVFE